MHTSQKSSSTFHLKHITNFTIFLYSKASSKGEGAKTTTLLKYNGDATQIELPKTPIKQDNDTRNNSIQ